MKSCLLLHIIKKKIFLPKIKLLKALQNYEHFDRNYEQNVKDITKILLSLSFWSHKFIYTYHFDRNYKENVKDIKKIHIVISFDRNYVHNVKDITQILKVLSFW